MAELAGSFEQYGAWRDTLARAVTRFRGWLQDNGLLDAWSPSSRAASRT